MLHITSLDDGLEIFKALGSEMRVEIVKTLLQNGSMNMNELAGRLGITNGALTSHIKKLEDCGIVTVSSEAGGHGNQKLCSVHQDCILVDLESQADKGRNVYNSEIKVGHFTDYEIYPTCGLASERSIIGEVDDARYFAHPDRFSADILWFTRGYIEYIIPNFIPASNRIDQITVSAELGSEAPGVNDVWPSDIQFSLNGTVLGSWTSPGDFGNMRGTFNPDWWYPEWNQYGILKLIAVNHQGTFIDGLKISDVNIDQLQLDCRSTIKFRFSVPDDAEHVGGLTIFGKSFGNYRQDINARISYSRCIE